MSCSKCKQKVIKVSEPVINEQLVNDDKLEKIKRLRFIFNSKNITPYTTELNFLWNEVFGAKLVLNNKVAKNVFNNYLITNNIKL